MGFFKKSVPSESKRTALTIIAKGNKICGAMSITGKLHIDGSIEGDITSVENVSIGKSGSVIGKTRAKNITVSGLLQGDVFCEHLHITTGGRVESKVECVELTMDAKSQFIGERKETDALSIEMVNLKLEMEKKTSQAQDMINDLPSKITLNEQKYVKPIADDNLEPIEKSEVSISFSDSQGETEKTIDKDVVGDRLVPKNIEKQKASQSKVKQSEAVASIIKPVSSKASAKQKVIDENTTKLELKF